MKKSQILAAIALAMALGVVAPVVSVENASAAARPANSDAAKRVDSEVAKMKAEFGTITTYNANGSTSVNPGYAYYDTVDAKLTNIETQIKMIDAAGRNSIISSLRDALVVSLSYQNYLSADTQSKITDAYNNGIANSSVKTYADAKALLAVVKAEFASKTEAGIGTTDYNRLQTKIADLDTYLTNAEAAADAEAVAHNNDAAVAALRTEAKNLTGVEPAAPTTLAEYNAIVNTVSSKFPKMEAFRRVKAELAKSGLENLDTSIYNERQINELISNMWAAYNGSAITNPSDKIVEEATGAKAPATGIVGTAEGTATTVSIVAGLATALTALGAGVVAYRSARRK